MIISWQTFAGSTAIGITIDFRGTIDDLEHIELFEDRVLDLAFALGGRESLWRSYADHDPQRIVRGLILVLLSMMKQTWFPDLEVSDESGHWDHRDQIVLAGSDAADAGFTHRVKLFQHRSAGADGRAGRPDRPNPQASDGTISSATSWIRFSSCSLMHAACLEIQSDSHRQPTRPGFPADGAAGQQ